ncbi:MAG: hypothetical protein K1X94_32505 [Sandaracinaceae bacterium]|nr:hypothetical protein [Sandaracinaceae bacterium]
MIESTYADFVANFVWGLEWKTIAAIHLLTVCQAVHLRTPDVSPREPGDARRARLDGLGGPPHGRRHPEGARALRADALPPGPAD